MLTVIINRPKGSKTIFRGVCNESGGYSGTTEATSRFTLAMAAQAEINQLPVNTQYELIVNGKPKGIFTK